MLVDRWHPLLNPKIYHSCFSETKLRGTVCGKSARTALWKSGKVTTCSTRKTETVSTNLSPIKVSLDELKEEIDY